jgi:hypothetical protein
MEIKNFIDGEVLYAEDLNNITEHLKNLEEENSYITPQMFKDSTDEDDYTIAF